MNLPRLAQIWLLRTELLGDLNGRLWPVAAFRVSCWNKGDTNQPFLSGTRQIPFREIAQCRIAVDHVIGGEVADPTGGAAHYYATTMSAAPICTTGVTYSSRMCHEPS